MTDLRQNIVDGMRRGWHVTVTSSYARKAGFFNAAHFAGWAWDTCRAVAAYDWRTDEIEMWRCGGSCRERRRPPTFPTERLVGVDGRLLKRPTAVRYDDR